MSITFLKPFLRWTGFVLLVLTLVVLSVWLWANRPAPLAPIPGYAWVASGDGTSDASMKRLSTALARRGVPTVYDSMIAACYYVPTNQVAKARLVFAMEKIKRWNSVWSIE